MKLLKKNKEKQNPQKQTLSYKNGNSASQSKSKDEIYNEKKQQLKYWQRIFENEKQVHEKRKSEHDAYVNTMNEELERIQQQMQNIRKKSKLKFIISLVVLAAFVGVSAFNLKHSHTKELEEFQQQLETKLNEYTGEIEIQKQDLQQQIETLTQQLDSLQ